MKFNEMTYTRPDIGALMARCKELAAKAAAAPDGDALVRLYYEQSEAFAAVSYTHLRKKAGDPVRRSECCP